MFPYTHICVLIVISIFVPHIFGTWLENIDDFEYDSDTQMSCYLWLINNGFDETDVLLNWDRARTREKNEDKTKFFMAAIYAQVLYSFPDTITNPAELLLTPIHFCTSRGMGLNDAMKFQSLENTENTCFGWTTIYGYKTYGEKYRNYDFAQSRNPDEDESISLWPTVYAWFITSHIKFKEHSIETFCFRIVDPEKKTKFMTLNDKKLNCRLWIALYGFDDYNVSINIAKAKSEKEIFKNYKTYTNNHARRYINELLILKPKMSELVPSTSVEASENAENEHMRPPNYCLDAGYPDERLVKYFG